MFAWSFQYADPSQVKLEPEFKDLLAHPDQHMKLWHLRARIGVVMQYLSEVRPTYSDADFILLNRKSARSVGKISVGPIMMSQPWRSRRRVAPRSYRTPTLWAQLMLWWVCNTTWGEAFILGMVLCLWMEEARTRLPNRGV